MKHFVPYMALALAWLCASCEDCTFTSRNSTNVAVRVYVYGRRASANLSFDSILTSRGAVLYRGRNLVFLPSEANRAGSYLLPVNPSQDTSVFVFVRTLLNPRRPRRDTIAIANGRQMAIVSPNCGYDLRIDNLRVVRSTFDSSAVLNSTLSIDDSVNLGIFVR